MNFSYNIPNWSKNSFALLFLSIIFILVLFPYQNQTSSNTKVKSSLADLPLMFEKNDGQTASPVSYLSRMGNYMIFFTPEEIVLDLRTPVPNETTHGKIRNIQSDVTSNTVLRLQFVGANKLPTLVGHEPLASKSNYFIGNNPKNWHKNIPNYAKIDYKNLYPGIDMTFYGNQNQLEYDIRVAKGADPATVRFQVAGAKTLHLNKKGDLIFATHEGNDLSMHKPVIYQMINGVKHAVSGSFVLLNKKEVGFKVGPYDKNQTLVIDPAINYSTYLGGSGGNNAALAVTVDFRDRPPNLFITGYTNSTDFPTQNPAQPTNKNKGRTAFVMKFDRLNNKIVYSTYLGGSGSNDAGFAIAVDGVTSAYVTGETNSNDFPTVNAFQPTNNGAKDFSAFVTKLNPEGDTLVYSTYLGGSGDNQEGNGIAVDNQGFAYVTGETSSTDFPIKNALQTTNKGPKFTAFVTKFDTVGNALVFSTYLGGSGGQDEGNGIAIDPNNNNSIWLTGETNSKDFPTKNPIQATPKPTGAGQTGFVTKLTSDGSSIVFSTYLGGSGGNDYPTCIAVGPFEDVLLGGYTNSTDFPLVNPIQSTNKGAGNGRGFTGFITKINPQANAILFSTYHGGSGGDDRVNAIAVNSTTRQVHIVGSTNSTDFPLLVPVQSTNMGSGTTGFESAFTLDGVLIQSTYLGGSGGNDQAFGVAVDNQLNGYIVGLTNSSDFPLVNAIQPTKTSAIMAFLTQITI